MRCETKYGRGLLLFKQVSHEVFKGDLSLSKWPLVKSRENLTVFNQRHQLSKEICRDDLDFSQQTLFMKRLKHRGTVCCAYIQPLRLHLFADKRQRLPVGFLGTLMRFDCRTDAGMRSNHCKGCRKATKLFGMVKRGKFTSDCGDMRLAIKLQSEKLGGQRSAGVGMCRDQADSAAVRGVARHAEHRSPMLRQPVNDRVKLSRVPRCEDNAVVIFLQSGFEKLQIPISETRVFVKRDLNVHSNRCCSRFAYAGAQRVEEVRDFFGEDNGDLYSAIEPQRLSREIRFVAQLVLHLLDLRFCLQAAASTVVQSTIHSSNRYPECLSYFFNSRVLRCAIHRFYSGSIERRFHRTGILHPQNSPFVMNFCGGSRDLHGQSIPRLTRGLAPVDPDQGKNLRYRFLRAGSGSSGSAERSHDSY